MADLKFLGRIFGVIGGLIMLIVGVVFVVSTLLEEITDLINDIVDFSLLTANIGGSFMGAGNEIVYAALMIICGVVAIYGYKQLGSSKDVLVWGIIYIIVAIIGGGLGALLVLIGGIILVIDHFL